MLDRIAKAFRILVNGEATTADSHPNGMTATATKPQQSAERSMEPEPQTRGHLSAECDTPVRANFFRTNIEFGLENLLFVSQKHLILAGQGTLECHDPRTGRSLWRKEHYANPTVTDNGQLWALHMPGYGSKAIRFVLQHVDILSGRVVAQFPCEGYVHDLQVAPDGNTIAMVQKRMGTVELAVFSTDSFEPLLREPLVYDQQDEYTVCPTGLQFSPDGKQVAISAFGMKREGSGQDRDRVYIAKVKAVQNRKTLVDLGDGSGDVNFLGALEDGRFLCTDGMSTLSLLSAQDGDRVFLPQAKDLEPFEFFDRNPGIFCRAKGTMVTLGESQEHDGSVFVVEVASGEILASFSTHDSVDKASLSSDGRALAISHFDQTIRVFPVVVAS